MLFANIAHWKYKINVYDIAEIINRKRTTILYYLKKYDTEYKYNKEFRAFADKVNSTVCAPD
ncbi:MAG: hypothetical protein FWD66_05630 [Paludibacter sp.]|nr:hypothetical protein [Paludibacter sp.]